MTHLVKHIPDVFEPLGGKLPDTYCMDNTSMWVESWTDPELMQQLGDLCGIDARHITTIKQPCGSCIIRHYDTLYHIRDKWPEDNRLRVRANIYLEDWEPGHFLGFQQESGEWFSDCNWKAGNGWIWDREPHHASANAGLTPKYTLQVTGFLLN